jgi:hypothetical protein
MTNFMQKWIAGLNDLKPAGRSEEDLNHAEDAAWWDAQLPPGWRLSRAHGRQWAKVWAPPTRPDGRPERIVVLDAEFLIDQEKARLANGIMNTTVFASALKATLEQRNLTNTDKNAILIALTLCVRAQGGLPQVEPQVEPPEAPLKIQSDGDAR